MLDLVAVVAEEAPGIQIVELQCEPWPIGQPSTREERHTGSYVAGDVTCPTVLTEGQQNLDEPGRPLALVGSDRGSPSTLPLSCR